MAKIAGITIELGADASGVEKALKDIDKSLKTTQGNLKDINKLLKLDPTNTELLTQKQKNLKDAVKQTEQRLTELKEAQKNVAEGTPEWDALQREIIATEQQLKKAEGELKGFGNVAAQVVAAAGKKVQEFGKKVEKVGKELSKISGVATGALVSMGKLGYDTMQTADDLATLSQKTGVSTDELQKWDYAASLVDVEVSTMAGAFSKLTQAMSAGSDSWVKGQTELGAAVEKTQAKLDALEAKQSKEKKGSKKWKAIAKKIETVKDELTNAEAELENYNATAEKLKSLDIEIKNDDGSFRDTTEVFYEVLAALSAIEDPVQRDIVAMDIFGKSAGDLAGIIDDGGAALKQYGQEAEEMGLILSSETLDALNEANNTVDRLKGTFKASFAQAGATLVQTFAPALEKVAGFLTTVAEKIASLSPEQAEMIVKILAVVAVIGPLVLVIGKIITGIGTLMTILPILMGPVGIVMAAVAAAIAIGVLLYKNWDKVKETAAQVGAAVVAAWEGLKAGVTAAASAVASWVTDKWNAIKTAVTTASEAVKTTATNAWNGIKTAITTVVTAIQSKIDAFKAKLDSLKQKCQQVVDKIKSIFKGEISFPKIKLPHFRVTGGVAPYGLGGKGTMPKISIDWYKKAYDNPVMFTSPTVMATPAGYKGFGDGSGAEIVMGLDKLRELVGGMDNNVNVNVYLQGDARQLFRVIRQENNVRTKATNYNALAVGG